VLIAGSRDPVVCIVFRILRSNRVRSNNLNSEYAKVKKVKIQNGKTGFGSIKKPIFGFAKTVGFPGYPVSVKTGLQTLILIAKRLSLCTSLHSKV
jgi:molybdopterin biosynthesis enzyme